MKKMRQLIINPGSTSTKIAVYDNETPLFERNLKHSTEELHKYAKVTDQFDFRKKIIIDVLDEYDVKPASIHAIVGRGGLLKPMDGGTYAVTDTILVDLHAGIQGEHASNLGGIIADAIARDLHIPAFIVDPVVVDELEPLARYSGHPLFERTSIFHALNQKAVARRAAKELGKSYEELNFIVAHLGGGVTVGAHKKGRVIDVTNGLTGEGPFSPERSGALPVAPVVDACFSGKYTKEQIGKMLKGDGGMVAYLGTNNAKNIEDAALAGDEKSRTVLLAMAYQTAKSIGECAAVLEGMVDAVIITGGLARCPFVAEEITRRVCFIATVIVYPGEDELLALAQGGLRVLTGSEKTKIYR